VEAKKEGTPVQSLVGPCRQSARNGTKKGKRKSHNLIKGYSSCHGRKPVRGEGKTKGGKNPSVSMRGGYWKTNSKKIIPPKQIKRTEEGRGSSLFKKQKVIPCFCRPRREEKFFVKEEHEREKTRRQRF